MRTLLRLVPRLPVLCVFVVMLGGFTQCWKAEPTVYYAEGIGYAVKMYDDSGWGNDTTIRYWIFPTYESARSFATFAVTYCEGSKYGNDCEDDNDAYDAWVRNAAGDLPRATETANNSLQDRERFIYLYDRLRVFTPPTDNPPMLQNENLPDPATPSVGDPGIPPHPDILAPVRDSIDRTTPTGGGPAPQ